MTSVKGNKIPLPELGNTPKSPPNQVETATNSVLNEIIPQDTKATITVNAKYDVDNTQKPKPQQRQQIPFNPVNFQNNNVSDNPILDFIQFWKDETDYDLYVLLTRLPDNPLTPNEFNKPCSGAITFAPFPFNPSSFLNDVVKVNGNSGGYFKILMVDENTEQIDGEILKRCAFANPYNPNATQDNHNNGNESALLRFMQDSEKRQTELLTKLFEKKEDKFANLAEQMLMKRFLSDDKPQTVDLPEEQKTMLAILGNPAMTKGVAFKIQESVENLFGNPARTEQTVKTASGILDTILNGVASSPELQGQLFMFADKLFSLAGLALSKIGQNKPTQPRPPRPNPNVAPKPQPSPNAAQTEKDFIDIEATDVTNEPDTGDELTPEQQAQELAIINSPFFKSVLDYIDSDEILILENPFILEARKTQPANTSVAIAKFKHETYEQVFDYLCNDMPFLEDFLNGREVDETLEWNEEKGKRREQRLREFHKLIVEKPD